MSQSVADGSVAPRFTSRGDVTALKARFRFEQAKPLSLHSCRSQRNVPRGLNRRASIHLWQPPAIQDRWKHWAAPGWGALG